MIVIRLIRKYNINRRWFDSIHVPQLFNITVMCLGWKHVWIIGLKRIKIKPEMVATSHYRSYSLGVWSPDNLIKPNEMGYSFMSNYENKWVQFSQQLLLVWSKSNDNGLMFHRWRTDTSYELLVWSNGTTVYFEFIRECSIHFSSYDRFAQWKRIGFWIHSSIMFVYITTTYYSQVVKLVSQYTADILFQVQVLDCDCYSNLVG